MHNHKYGHNITICIITLGCIDINIVVWSIRFSQMTQNHVLCYQLIVYTRKKKDSATAKKCQHFFFLTPIV